jgi:threonine dehydratase
MNEQWPLTLEDFESVARAINAQVPHIVEVSEEEIQSAMRHYFTDTHQIAEGAWALPLSALLKDRDRNGGKRTDLVLSGGNVGASVYATILQNS